MLSPWLLDAAPSRTCSNIFAEILVMDPVARHAIRTEASLAHRLARPPPPTWGHEPRPGFDNILDSPGLRRAGPAVLIFIFPSPRRFVAEPRPKLKARMTEPPTTPVLSSCRCRSVSDALACGRQCPGFHARPHETLAIVGESGSARASNRRVADGLVPGGHGRAR